MLDFEQNLANSLNQPLEDLFEFWTPNEIQNYIDSVKSKVTSLHRDIEKNLNCLNEQYLLDWADFIKRFDLFAKSANTWFLGSLRTAERYANELRGYQNTFSELCKKKPTSPGIIIPKEEQKKDIQITSGLANSIVIGALIIGGLFLLPRFIK